MLTPNQERYLSKIPDDQKMVVLPWDSRGLDIAQQVKNGEPHKFDNVAWFTLQNMPSPVHSQPPVFLEKYKNKL